MPIKQFLYVRTPLYTGPAALARERNESHIIPLLEIAKATPRMRTKAIEAPPLEESLEALREIATHMTADPNMGVLLNYLQANLDDLRDCLDEDLSDV